MGLPRLVLQQKSPQNKSIHHIFAFVSTMVHTSEARLCYCHTVLIRGSYMQVLHDLYKGGAGVGMSLAADTIGGISLGTCNLQAGR